VRIAREACGRVVTGGSARDRWTVDAVGIGGNARGGGEEDGRSRKRAREATDGERSESNQAGTRGAKRRDPDE
jgi:hypothetical protein